MLQQIFHHDLLRSAALLVCLSSPGFAQISTHGPAHSTLPHLQHSGAVTQLIVDCKPLVLLSGELHNSSPSSPEYMRPIWDKLQAAHLNSVIGAASWELVEPEEGHFNFTAVDDQVRQAKAHGMHLVLIWFGSFKNASYSYTPMWVKRDPQRFALAKMLPKDGGALRPANTLSVFSQASQKADAHAFAALMAHLRIADPSHVVVMVQVENETGSHFASRDHSELADAAYNSPVPQELTAWLASHRDTMLPELKAVWDAAGARPAGTWPEMFGPGPVGDEVFMAWFTAKYLQTVAEAGTRELALPMYANAWLVQFPGQLPGDYPSGGPVSRMMDVWRLAAPRLALLAPDIYLGDFDGVCASYTRSGNPLFIPEARASTANLFLAVGKYHAIGYSPFGIDGPVNDPLLSSAYEALEGVMPVLTAAQAKGTVQFITPEAGGNLDVSLGSYILHMERGIHGAPSKAKKPEPATAITQDIPPAPGETVKPKAAAAPTNAYLRPFDDARRGMGLVIPDGADSFYIVGTGLALTAGTHEPGRIARIGLVEEGSFVNGRWTPGRRLNGDETYANFRLLLEPDAVRIFRVSLFTIPQ